MPSPSLRMEKLEKAERGELTVAEMKDLIEMLKCQAEIEAIQAETKTTSGEESAPTRGSRPTEAKANKRAASNRSPSSRKACSKSSRNYGKARSSSAYRPATTPSGSRRTKLRTLGNLQ